LKHTIDIIGRAELEMQQKVSSNGQIWWAIQQSTDAGL